MKNSVNTRGGPSATLWFVDTLQGMDSGKSGSRPMTIKSTGPRLLRMPDVLNSRSACDRWPHPRNRDASAAWKERLRRLIGGGNNYTSPEMRDLVVELIGDGTLDQVHPGITVDDDWWFQWYGLGTKQPEFAIRILGAWFDRQIARAAALGQPDPFAPRLVHTARTAET